MIEFLVTAMGVLMSVGYYPQAYRIIKNKSVVNISLPTYIIFSIGTFTWLMYGFYLNDPVIIISFIIGVFGSWLVAGLTIYFRYIKRAAHKSDVNMA